MEPALRTGPSEVGASRRLVGRGREAGVAAPAPRAADREHALARRRQVAERLAGVAVGDDGPQRHLQDQVLAAGAVTVGTLTVGPALGVVVPAVGEIAERAQRGRGLEAE